MSNLKCRPGSSVSQLGKDRGKKELYLPVCLSMSSILVWKTWSTASTLTPVPLCGMANTSTTRTVYSSTNSPSIRPITSMGTPALPAIKDNKQIRKKIMSDKTVTSKINCPAQFTPYKSYLSEIYSLQHLWISNIVKLERVGNSEK